MQRTTRTRGRAPADGRPRSGVLTGLLRTARPRQWLKNLLVLAAPTFAGVLTEPVEMVRVAIAFVAFCLAASGTYLINDARDVQADRVHPRKRMRPVASGVVGVRLAVAVGVLCLLLAVAVSALTGSWQLPVVILTYVGLTTTYSVWLKRIVILDLVGVAAGFVLRAVAGAAAVQVELSGWFLIVSTLGSLLVVAGKREAELRAVLGTEGEPGSSRATLGLYTPEYLRYVRATTSGALLVSYCLWAIELHVWPAQIAFGLSIVPVAVAILRYAMLVDRGEGEVPEELLLSDRMLLASGVLAVLCMLVGVYVL